jgi:uncharacterized protein YajQ (UPF0234 family)
MTIRQVIDLAKTSELANLSIGNKDEIVLGYINLGMIELYKRFNLRVEEWVVTLEDNVDIYTTPSDFMWAIAAYGEVTDNQTDSVNELPINEEDNPLSINTVKWNKIQVLLSVTGAYVSIIYAASPVYYAKTLTLISSSDNKIDAMLDIMISKMNKRDISINSLEELKKEDSSGGNRKYSYKIIDSIEKDEAKRIQTEIKNLKLKVSAVNQGDTIRVTGKNIDDLQAVMRHLKSLDLKAPLVFDNFK